jgi:hypothetical protein
MDGGGLELQQHGGLRRSIAMALQLCFVNLGNEEIGALCRIGFGRIRFYSCERISAEKVFVKTKYDRDNNEDLRWSRRTSWSLG